MRLLMPAICAALLAGCATQQKPVVLWAPIDESEDAWSRSAQQVAICRAKAHEAVAAGSGGISQNVTTRQHDTMLDVSAALTAQENRRQTLSSIMEGCMAEAGYRKIVTTNEEIDRFLEQQEHGADQ